MGVIVTSTYSKSGPAISGDTIHIVKKVVGKEQKGDDRGLVALQGNGVDSSAQFGSDRHAAVGYADLHVGRPRRLGDGYLEVGLARRLRIAGHVEQVIDDLEREAEILGVRGQRRDRLRGGSRGHGAAGRSGDEQGSGLAAVKRLVAFRFG